MGHLREMDLGASFRPFAALREQLGYVPNVFRAQTLLPTVIEAEVGLVDAVLFQERVLSRIQKECILLMLAAANEDSACSAIHYQMLRLLSVPEQRLDQILADYSQAGLSPANAALVALALRVGTHVTPISREDVRLLTDDAALEAILTTALGNFLCTLSTGLGVAPDFPPRYIPPTESVSSAGAAPPLRDSGPFLSAPDRSEDDFAPFKFFREQFGVVPAVFRAQTLRPDVIEAEAKLIRAVLFSEGHLTRDEKDAVLRGELPPHNEHLTDEQVLEAAVTTAVAHFLRTLQDGLGAAPDLHLRDFRRMESKKAHLSAPDQRHTDVAISADPDAECVASVRSGDLGAFEELMNRHRQRVYRTLIGLLGDMEEARDAMQDTFLKAFQKLGSFEGRSKFSTWLLTIASNTAIQRLRDRKHVESLDEPEPESEEGFRPRQVQAWTEDPEQLYSKNEMRSLVEGAIMKLPIKYRAVLIARDIQQLSTEESAAVLNLGVPALKARLLRARLMLREALAPHFVRGAPGVAS
jgi:RNA polymerase sigma-70 factor (ECF subfamily)